MLAIDIQEEETIEPTTSALDYHIPKTNKLTVKPVDPKLTSETSSICSSSIRKSVGGKRKPSQKRNSVHKSLNSVNLTIDKSQNGQDGDLAADSNPGSALLNFDKNVINL
jgi:hypothetical protein